MKHDTSSDKNSYLENSGKGGIEPKELNDVFEHFGPPVQEASDNNEANHKELIDPFIPNPEPAPAKELIDAFEYFDPTGQDNNAINESNYDTDILFEPISGKTDTPNIADDSDTFDERNNSSPEIMSRIRRFMSNGAQRAVSHSCIPFYQVTDMQIQNTACSNTVTPYTLKKGIKPTETLHKLLSRYHFRIMNESLYYYNGICYEYLSPTRAKILINSLCRDDITVVGHAKHVDGIYDLMMLEEGIMIDDNTLFQESRNHIAFHNGILDLQTKRFIAGTPDLFVHFQLNSFYSSSASSCPVFNAFLHTITNGDPVLIQRIWEVIGYCLTPDFSAKAIVLLQGVSNSGKSQFSNFLTEFFPHQNVTSLGIHEFDKDFTKAELIGKHLCICPDMPSSRLSAITASELKQLSGNDLMTANIKFYPHVKFRNTAKLICATNHAVYTADDDDTFYNRLVTIPFRYAVPRECMNHDLIQSLIPEIPAVVNRAIDSYYTLKNNNYVFSGYYPLNAPDTIQGGKTHTLEDKLLDFLQKHLISQKTGVVFVDDIQMEFKREHNITLGQNDMKVLKRIMEQVFKAEQCKLRKPGLTKSNPISAYKGYVLDSDLASPVPVLI